MVDYGSYILKPMIQRLCILDHCVSLVSSDTHVHSHVHTDRVDSPFKTTRVGTVSVERRKEVIGSPTKWSDREDYVPK